MTILRSPRMRPLEWVAVTDAGQHGFRAPKPTWGHFVIYHAYGDTWALFDQTPGGYTCMGLGLLETLKGHADALSTHRPRFFTSLI